MSAHVLLIETAQGATVAVRFPSIDAAREWEDAHPDVEGVGCAVLVTRKEALELGRFTGSEVK